MRAPPRTQTLAVALALALVLLAASPDASAQESSDPKPTNLMCPVMPDEPVDPEISVDHEGTRVWLCCGRCRKKFLEDPTPFLANVPQLAPDAGSGHAHDDDGHGDHDGNGGGSAHAHGDDAHGNDHGGTGHDHATDHGDHPHGPARLVRFLGKLHPIAIHFPIALVLVAALAELLVLVRGPRPLAEATARVNIAAGAAGAVVAAGLGWAAGAFARYPGELASVLGWHRWLGTGSAIVIVAAAVLSELARRREDPKLLLGYRAALLVAALLLGATGFYGGSLVFGPDHLSF